MAEGKRGERVFEGLGVSPGIGIGTVHIRDGGGMLVQERSLSPDRIEAERQRFRDAASRARHEIVRLRRKAESEPGSAAEEMGYLLAAYERMLTDSRLLRGVDRRITEDHINAEAAVQAEIAEIAKGFSAMEDAYIAARLEDIRDVGTRLIRYLTRRPLKPTSLLPRGSVVVAEELTPADTASMDPRRIQGLAAATGGAEGHTAILARALSLPAVLGVAGLMTAVQPGDPIIVDGRAGRVIVNPDPQTVAAYERRRSEIEQETRRLARLRRVPAVTRDGTPVTLEANVELPLEMNLVKHVDAAGIGLLRSEFMFMNREDVPDEEEQYLVLRSLVEQMGDRPVTIRTLDIGGEKTAAALMGDDASSASSALGLRGIRLTLKHTEILETQFRAILRAAAHGNVRILLPMVTTVSEVRRSREILKRAARSLRRRRIEIPDPLPPVGVMIEVPGAALSADALAVASDFFAIGSNDLTMYTLAIDRSDEQVANLYDPLHPAVLRLMQFSCQAALRADIPVSICGEMAGDPRYTALLLGLGFRELSMTATNVPKVKQRIRDLELSAADRRAQVIMDQVDAGRIAILLDDFNTLA